MIYNLFARTFFVDGVDNTELLVEATEGGELIGGGEVIDGGE